MLNNIQCLQKLHSEFPSNYSFTLEYSNYTVVAVFRGSCLKQLKSEFPSSAQEEPRTGFYIAPPFLSACSLLVESCAFTLLTPLPLLHFFAPLAILAATLRFICSFGAASQVPPISFPVSQRRFRKTNFLSYSNSFGIYFC